jgi:hypothetical protein
MAQVTGQIRVDIVSDPDAERRSQQSFMKAMRAMSNYGTALREVQRLTGPTPMALGKNPFYRMFLLSRFRRGAWR